MSFRLLIIKKTFYPLFWTQFLGAFNDNFLKNALVIGITIQSVKVFGLPTEQTVALAGGLFILPFFLFSAIAGEISDKYDKSKVLQATKLLEIGVMLLSAWALIIKNYDFLMITLFLMGLQSAFFGPAKFSILPQHLPATQILLANAWVEAATFLAILLGTILGGIIISLKGGHEMVAVLLVLIAILGYLTSRSIPLAPSSQPHLALNFELISATWKQFQFSRQDKKVFAAMMAGSWFWFVGAFILSLLPSLCTKYFQSNENLITFFLTVFSVGIGGGSFLSSRVSHQKVKLKIVQWGALGMSGSLLALFILCLRTHETPVSLWSLILSPHGALVTITLFCLSVASGLYIVPLNSYIQEASDEKKRSRIIATYNISNSLFMVLSSLFLMALFAMALSYSSFFLILFLLNLVVLVSLPRFLKLTYG